MKKISKKNMFDLVLSCLLSGIVTFVMLFLLERTEIPLDKSGRLIFALLFPVAMFLFHLISAFASTPGCHRRASRLDQWAMLWIIPFFLLGFSWRLFGSWQVVFSMFNWLYITTRMGMIFAFRQSPKHPRNLNIADFLIVFTGLTLLNIGRFDNGNLTDIACSVLNAAILSLIAFLCAHLAGDKSIDGFAGTIYQRLFILQIAISIPLLGNSNHVTVFHLLSAGVLLFLIFITSDEKKSQYASICIAAFIMVLTPIVFPEGVVLSLWICLILIEQDRKKKLFEGILIPGGSIVLFMVGFLIAAIRYKGLYPQGNLIYRLSTADVFFAPLIDQTHGLIPLLPWFVMVLAGWVIAYRNLDSGKFRWIAFPVVLYGLTLGSWISNGTAPGWDQWLLVIPFFFPFYGALWSKSSNSLMLALVRVSALFGFLISGLLYVYLSVFRSRQISLTDLLDYYANQTGIELHRALPAISHHFPGNSDAVWLWLFGISLIVMMMVLTSRFQLFQKHSEKSGILEIAVVTIALAVFGVVLSSCRVWSSVPLETEVQINPGDSWTVPRDFQDEVEAVKIVSNLSRSTHVLQGQPIAEVIFEGVSGESEVQPLLAGVHTAEWAYNRADVLRIIRHSRPQVAWSWNVEEPTGSTFAGLAYQGLVFSESPGQVSAIVIRNTQPEHGAVLSVKAIGIMSKSDSGKITSPLGLVLNTSISLNSVESVKTFSLPGDVEYERLFLDSALVNSAACENGKPIGKISITGRDGMSKLWIVKAGRDTAEWSIERPDMIGRVLHSAPPIAVSHRRTHNGKPYLGNVYRSKWNWTPKIPVTEISIELISDLESTANREWVIYNLVLR